MNAIVKNISRLYAQHTKSIIIILLNLIFSTATIFILLQNYYYLKIQYNSHYGTTKIAKNYNIDMSFNDLQEYTNDCINDDSPMNIAMMEVINEIENNQHLTLYNMSAFSLYPTKLDNPLLWNNYLNESDETEQFIDCLSLSENAIKVFNLKTSDGTLFSTKDFETDDLSKPINVIMGYNLKKVFNLGDTFSYEGDTAKVIGFLPENSFYEFYGAEQNLDNIIIFPNVYLPRDTSSSSHFQYLYCDDPSIDVQATINSITAKNGYYALDVEPIDGIEITSTKNISEKNIKLIAILALIACTICTISLASILINRAYQDRSTYCIYLCNGIPMWKINLSLVIEMLIYLTLSFFPTYAISISEYGELLVPIWQIAIFALIVTGVSLIPTFMANKKCNLDILIRDKID